MSLDASLVIASSGLTSVSRGLSIVSQNVANANSPGYMREVATRTSVNAAGTGMGVKVGPTTRDIDTALQTRLYAQQGSTAAATTLQTALQKIDSLQGAPGQGTDLASLVGAMQDSFSTLANDPGDAVRQRATVTAASAVAQQMNTLSANYTAGRQDAQNAIVAGVAALNTQLSAIGKLNAQIVQARAAGQDSADLENQRDTAMSGVAGLIGAKFLERPNGEMVVMTDSGLALPTGENVVPFTVQDAGLGATSTYPGGGVPGVMLNGVDVTRQITSGSLGGNIALRDITLPGYQAQLDEMAQTMSTRFDAQGLTLFTDGTGNVPTPTGATVQAGYVGYGATIQVNPAIVANPALVRDGTHAVAGSATGATAFTPNPSTGPAGFTTLITRVLNFAMGSEVQTGVPQPAPATSGLGPAGTLNAPTTPVGDLSSIASTLIAGQAQDVSDAANRASSEAALRDTLMANLSKSSGVSVDTEMTTLVQLQNSYAANARVVTTLQSLWAQVLQMVS
jgi:flagellar hook-associated protein 1